MEGKRLGDSIATWFGKAMCEDADGDTTLVVSAMMTALAVTQLDEFLPEDGLGYRAIRWIAEATEARSNDIFEHIQEEMKRGQDEEIEAFDARVKDEMIALARNFAKMGSEAARSDRDEHYLVMHAYKVSWPLQG